MEKSTMVRKTAVRRVARKLVAVVITTAHKGVFFGYVPKVSKSKDQVLKQARMCVSWSSDIRGVHGLAAVGPSNRCKIGFAVPELLLQDITSVAACTPEAVVAWEKAPWD